MKRDSKTSFGSIETTNKFNDSLADAGLDIDKAWAERYGGK